MPPPRSPPAILLRCPYFFPYKLEASHVRNLFDGMPQKNPTDDFIGAQLGNSPKVHPKNVLSSAAHLVDGSGESCNLSIQKSMAWHAHLAKTPRLLSDEFASAKVIDAYCKSGALDEAFNLLERMHVLNSVKWNHAISGYNKSCQFDKSLRTFHRLRLAGAEATQFTYGGVLSACSALENVELARQIHCLVIKDGYILDDFIRTGLLDLFAKNCCFDEAMGLFVEIPTVHNVVCWNAIIAGAVRNGDYVVALELFGNMHEFCLPSGFTISSVLTACTAIVHLDLGMGVHGFAAKCGALDDIFVGTGIIGLYMKCGDINDAIKEFSLMPVQNAVSWTSMISGFVQREEPALALQFLTEMRQEAVGINKFTLTSILAGLSSPKFAKEVSLLHGLTAKIGLLSYSEVGNALIGTYAKNGDIELSVKMFEEMGTVRDMSSWAGLISGLSQCQKPMRAIELFQRMIHEGLRPDDFCSTGILSVVNCLYIGRQLHSYILKSNMLPAIYVASALLTMYYRCGNLGDSYDVFHQMIDRDKVTWTSMIAGLVNHGYVDDAVRLSHQMIIEGIIPDQMTLIIILSACSSHTLLTKGKEIHGFILRADLFSEELLMGALITMYSNCGSLIYAVRAFSNIHTKDHNSWSAMVSGYAQNGYCTEAALTFHQMTSKGLIIDHCTLSSALRASSSLLDSSYGKSLHAYIWKAGYHADFSVSSALVTMYSKCGSAKDSYRVFAQINEPDLVTWTALIDNYAHHGDGNEAVKTYQTMIESGIKPDSITFISILSACSHNNLIKEGSSIFDSMRTYGIEPDHCHFACMVDLFCRSGRLKEAESFIEKMPIKPDALIWSVLLDACKLHGELDLAKKAAENIFEMDCNNSGTYISLSNICAELGDWEGVVGIRKVMKRVGSKKEPGWSSM